MQEILNTLRPVDNCLQTNITLPCWANYSTTAYKNETGKVTLTIGEMFGEKPATRSTAIENALSNLLEHAPTQQQIILDKLLVEYAKWQPDYGYSPEDAKNFMPDVQSIDSFKNLITLSQIHILNVALDGVAYLGYEFECEWDVEHGMGCMFHKNRLIQIGMAECSFQAFRAEQDIEKQLPQRLFFEPTYLLQSLFQFTKTAFAKYIASTPEIKDIYVLAYDFDTFENVIYLSLNTVSDHEKTIKEYKALPYMQQSISTPEGVHEVKYAPGNFKHCCFDEFKVLTNEQLTAWKGLNTDDDKSDSYKQWYENYNALCDAISQTLAIYLGSDDIKLLPITASVTVIAKNKHESFIEAEKRMKRYLANITTI
jgi:hypothetical protein